MIFEEESYSISVFGGHRRHTWIISGGDSEVSRLNFFLPTVYLHLLHMHFLLPHHLLFPLIWRLYCLGVVIKVTHDCCWLVMNGLETFWPNLGFFINRLNLFNQFSTIAGCLSQPWGTPNLSLSGSHSSGFGIENHFFCLLPYAVRNFLAKFGIFYQPSEPVQRHSWLPLSAMRNPWPFFVWFSLIRVKNWEPFHLFASLFS